MCPKCAMVTKVRTHVLIQLDTKRVPNREDITMSDEMQSITDDMLATPDHTPKIRVSVCHVNGNFYDKTFTINSTKSLGMMIGYLQGVTDQGAEVVLSD